MGTPAMGVPARPGPASVSWLRRFQTGCSRWERLSPGPGAVRLPITPADPSRLLTSTLPAGCRDKGPPRAVGIMSGRSVLYRKVISTLKALLASAVAGEIARRLTQEKTKAGRAASGRFLPRIVLPPAAGSARGLFSSAAHLHAGLHRCDAAEHPQQNTLAEAAGLGVRRGLRPASAGAGHGAGPLCPLSTWSSGA